MIAWIGFGAMIVASLLLLRFITRQLAHRPAPAPDPLKPATVQDGAALVIWSGDPAVAEQLALRTAESLRSIEVLADVVAMSAITARALRAATRLFFVVTTGQYGEAPEDAETFLRHEAAPIAGRPYAVLVLGARRQPEASSFGKRLDSYLKFSGAVPMTAPIEADRDNVEALRHWQALFRAPAPASPAVVPAPIAPPAPAPANAPFTPWRLISRELINAGSSGSPIYHLRLEPEDALPEWRAGTIVEVYPGPADQAADGDPAHESRNYSVASLPADGAVELVVRARRNAEGVWGIGSEWLCHLVQPGQRVALRLRDNPGFAPPPDDVPMILIGNGSGIAGLRAHIRARPPGTRNWLIFGERNSAYDCLMGTEIANWVSIGHLERCDLIFSRDGPTRRYVRHHIADAEAQILDWILAGAAIYVCGNLLGMGNDVDAELKRILGREVLDAMVIDGRYRRDVY
ncbi:MAG: Sulfite reductase flavoprotein alpha-component [Rhizorhabdus sp.]|nr:Sulfite reductase flavoprotein alpha-component [Rhizorhabdus sp.]